jgi:hypothetical protein
MLIEFGQQSESILRRKCLSAESILRCKLLSDSEREQEQKLTSPLKLPRVMVPSVGNWYRPLRSFKRTDLVVFDELEIDHWMQTHFDWLYDDNSFQTLSQSKRVQLCGVCAVYRLDGISASLPTSL